MSMILDFQTVRNFRGGESFQTSNFNISDILKRISMKILRNKLSLVLKGHHLWMTPNIISKLWLCVISRTREKKFNSVFFYFVTVRVLKVAASITGQV